MLPAVRSSPARVGQTRRGWPTLHVRVCPILTSLHRIGPFPVCLIVFLRPCSSAHLPCPYGADVERMGHLLGMVRTWDGLVVVNERFNSHSKKENGGGGGVDARFANYIGKLPPHQLTFLLDLLSHPSIGLGFANYIGKLPAHQLKFLLDLLSHPSIGLGFANYIGKLPAHQLKFLLDLLFHPSIGLGFANYIGKLPAHQLKFLLDLLFHPSIGLGFANYIGKLPAHQLKFLLDLLSHPSIGLGFANYIGKLPAHQLKFLLDLLFHPSIGLGLNLARYLIGGSFNPLLSPQFLTEACEAMAIPGYRVTASGPYDWSADWRQRKWGYRGAKYR
ncbi:unnamed protein product [Closterium sp. Naga37s-1]|nr:unnamed protein product [Closterium sp. Naga37s-1]